AIERLWRFQRAKRESLEIALRVTPMLKQHKLEEAIALTSDKKYRHSHLARVLRAGLTEFQYESSQSLPEDFDLVAAGQRAIGRVVAIPVVWLYTYFLNKVDRFQVEMSNSSSQLIDYFIKNEARMRAGTRTPMAAR